MTLQGVEATIKAGVLHFLEVVLPRCSERELVHVRLLVHGLSQHGNVLFRYIGSLCLNHMLISYFIHGHA